MDSTRGLAEFARAAPFGYAARAVGAKRAKKKPAARDQDTRRTKPRDPLIVLEAIAQVWLSTPEHEHLLPGILDVARKFVGADDASILMVDRSGKYLVEEVQAGRLRTARLRLRIRAEGVTGWVAAFQETAIIPDVRKDSRYVVTEKSIRSEAAMPILIGDRLAGVFNLESKKVGYFKPKDMRLLRLLTTQVSLAVQMEEQRERGRRHAEHFALLFNLSRLSHGVLPPAPFLQRVVDQTRAALGCYRVSAFIGDYEREEVVLLAHAMASPVGIEVGYRQSFQRGIIGHAFRLGETINVSDVRQEPNYVPGGKDTLSELCVPIRVGYRCLGILDLEASQEAAFGSDDVMFVETLGRFLVPTVTALTDEAKSKTPA